MRTSEAVQEKAPDISKTTMAKAAVLQAPQKVSLEEIELPKPSKGEVRIKLEGSGVCASNIPVWEGRDWFDYPVTPGEPGHEGWGIIDAVGEGITELKEGDRVTALTYKAYATHDIAKEDSVVKLPDFLQGKPFPGEPLGCAMNIFNRSDIQKGQKVAIVGSGFLGTLLVQLAKSAGAEVIAVSRREFSLDTAKKAGADHLVKMDDHYKIIEKIKELTGGNFCERVIECTGKEWPLNLSIELTGTRGKLIVAGFHQDGMRSLNVQMLNWRGIDMISAHERDPQQYISGIKDAVKAVEEGKMDPFPLFTHSFSLEKMDKAYKHLTDRPEGFVKALIVN
ncbi:MDR/zinc-dependent alcohol dehydrogenase-like family protein [Salinimicrobium sp. TH3]|uniref:MDR/zinc-dependent alcohol dehydrogenase-like family protein n=1 Tax=Salinimicrobium sp. TH3 TaxID=2997342 RepID=UPI002276679C|nr:zinc-binding dehydrogenase [Salinimicrobium sp. TH3]MCY2686607.1 zinc-binding dehydrogenase [Salinimicrobium sp. TH3]